MTKIKFNVLAIICIIAFAFAMSPKTLQNDTFYTISTGEHILENGIDGEDPFAWTDLKYTYPHWLYDVGVYLVYQARRYAWYIYFNNGLSSYSWNFTLYN